MIEMDDAIRIVMENTQTIDKTRVGSGRRARARFIRRCALGYRHAPL